MKSNKWYRLQVAKLYAIIKGEDDKISKAYLQEKVGRILEEIPIVEHMSLKTYVATLFYDDQKVCSEYIDDEYMAGVGFTNKKLQDLEDINLEESEVIPPANNYKCIFQLPSEEEIVAQNKEINDEKDKKGICKYVCYNRCVNLAVEDGYCQEHKDEMCRVCGKKATRGCSYCGQLVCGIPLCDNCGCPLHDEPRLIWRLKVKND